MALRKVLAGRKSKSKGNQKFSKTPTGKTRMQRGDRTINAKGGKFPRKGEKKSQNPRKTEFRKRRPKRSSRARSGKGGQYHTLERLKESIPRGAKTERSHASSC